jgi:amidase
MADSTDLAFAGLARHAELIASGEVSSRELVELFLARIDRYDPVLNAYRTVYAERARAEADQADGRRRAGERRPLLGVPVAVKDDIDIAGEVTGLGSDATTEPAPADAEVVRRLRSAGAVILGKTHVPELTITPFTESPTFGVTRNPWDLQRTPGGSSGGSAAAVAAGLASGALGSDGAGSIRIPAGCCGLFGVKPQRGRIPTAPLTAPWRGMTTWGPIGRAVADWARCADAIADGAPGFADAAAAPPRPLRIALAVGLPPGAGAPDVEQRGAVSATATALRDLGHEVVDRDLDWPAPLGGRVIARFLRGIADQAAAVPHPERLGRRARGFARLGGAIPEPVVAAAERAAPADAARLNAVFAEGFDVVLTPMFTRRPPRVREYDGRSVAYTLPSIVRLVPYCGAFNHTGQPAAAVPAGFAGDGFPRSVQLVAPADGEPVLLSLAAQLEEATGWPAHRPPATP